MTKRTKRDGANHCDHILEWDCISDGYICVLSLQFVVCHVELYSLLVVDVG